MTITVLNEYATLGLILKEHVSLARYGDGEFKLCWGKHQKSQAPNTAIQLRLREILLNERADLLVGIPNIWDAEALKSMPHEKREFWKRYSGKRVTDLLSPDAIYASSFVSRPDSAPTIDKPEYWQRWQEVWSGKRVLLVQGQRANFNKAGLLNTASHVTTWRGPDRDAFNNYPSLLGKITHESKRARADLIVLALGPTATVLAADLSDSGYWALDLGHMGMCYAHERWRQKKG